MPHNREMAEQKREDDGKAARDRWVEMVEMVERVLQKGNSGAVMSPESFGSTPRPIKKPVTTLRLDAPTHALTISKYGRFVVTAGDDGVRLWDLATGTCVAILQIATTTTIRHVETVMLMVQDVPKVLVIITSDQDDTWIWEVSEYNHSNNAKVTTIVMADQCLAMPSVACAKFFHNTHCIVLASTDGTIQMCDLAWDNNEAMDESNRQVIVEDHDHYQVHTIHISPNNQYIMTNDTNGRIKLWDVAAKTFVHTLDLMTCHSCLWSRDNCIMTYGDDLIRTWEAKSLRCWDTFSPPHKVRTLSGVTTDGCVLLTAGSGGNSTTVAHLWDTWTGQLIHRFETTSGASHQRAKHLASMTGDGSIVATTCSHNENEVLIWHTTVGECLHTLSVGEKINEVVMTGSHILIGSRHGNTCGWDIAQFNEIDQQEPILELKSSAAMIAVSVDGSLVATAGENDLIAKIWDGRNGAFLRTLSPTHCTSSLMDLAVHDANIMVTACADGSATTWSPSTGEPLLFLTGHSGPVSCVYFSKDGSNIVTGSHDCMASFWDTQTGECTMTFEGHEDFINAVAMTTIQKNSIAWSSVVTGSEDGTARVWDTETGFCQHVLTGHQSGVTMLSVARDIDRIITAARSDKKMLVWNSNGDLLLTVPTTVTISSLDMSFDGLSVVAAANNDNTIWMWLLDSMITKSWDRYESALPVSPLTINDRFLAGIDDAAHQDPDEYQWDLFEKANDQSLSLALLMDISHFEASKVMMPQEQRMLLKPEMATFENPLLLAIRHGNAASGYLRRMLRAVPHEGVRKRLYHDETDEIENEASNSKVPPLLRRYATSPNARRTKQPLLSRYRQHFNSSTSTRQAGPVIREMAAKKEKTNLLVQALYHGNEGCLDVVLDLYIELLTPPLGYDQRLFVPKTSDKLAFRVFKGNNVPLSTKYGRHVADDIDVEDLCLMALDFPTRFLDFVRQLKSVPNYDEANLDLPRLKLKRSDAVHRLAGSDERLPPIVDKLSFWKRIEKQDELVRRSSIGRIWTALQILLGVRETVALSVSPGLIPIKNIVGLQDDDTPSPFLKTVVQAAQDVGDISAFSNEVVEKVVEFKWKAYVKQHYILDAFCFIALFVVFIIESLAFGRDSDTTDFVFSLFLWACVAVLLTHFIWIELRQIWKCIVESSFRPYFDNGWNVVDLTSIIMIIITLSLRMSIFIRGEFSQRAVDLAHELSAISMPFLALEALYYLRGFQESGALVRMFVRVTGAIRTFSLILFIFIASNAAGFQLVYPSFVLERKDVHLDMDFTTYDQALLTVFGMLFGQFTQSDLSLSLNPAIASLLLVWFLFVTAIVLLNLLIAIMSDKYSEVQSNAVAEATYSRAQLILEFETRIPPKRKRAKQKEWFPTWIQVLRKGKAYDTKASVHHHHPHPLVWLDTCKENEQSELSKVKENLEQDIAHLQSELLEMKEESKTSLDQIKDDMKVLKDAIGAMVMQKRDEEPRKASRNASIGLGVQQPQRRRSVAFKDNFGRGSYFARTRFSSHLLLRPDESIPEESNHST